MSTKEYASRGKTPSKAKQRNVVQKSTRGGSKEPSPGLFRGRKRSIPFKEMKIRRRKEKRTDGEDKSR